MITIPLHLQIGLGAVHAEDLGQTPSNGSHPPAYTSHPVALALASSSRGESRQHVSRDLRPGCRVRARSEDKAYIHLWAVFLCRPCAAGMGWEGHEAFYTTSKRCDFCVRRASYGADGGQVSVATVVLTCC